MMAQGHKLAVAAALVLLGFAAAGAGCGAPSSFDLCLASCDAQQRCGVLSDTAAANCRNDCVAKKGALSDQDRAQDQMCQNSGAIRAAQLNCAHLDCNKIAGCLLTDVPGCINR